jgi:hypothetical protein
VPLVTGAVTGSLLLATTVFPASGSGFVWAVVLVTVDGAVTGEALAEPLVSVEPAVPLAIATAEVLVVTATSLEADDDVEVALPVATGPRLLVAEAFVGSCESAEPPPHAVIAAVARARARLVAMRDVMELCDMGL